VLSTNPLGLAQQTLRSLRISHKAHRRAAAAFERRATWLGVATVIATTAAGTTFFSAASSSDSLALRILAGAFSMMAAVLAALQTALKYTDRCAKHAAVAHQYGVVRRDAEELLAIASKRGVDDSFVSNLKAIRRKWSEIDEAAPHVSQDMYDRVVRKLARIGDPHATSPSISDVRLAAILDDAAAG